MSERTGGLTSSRVSRQLFACLSAAAVAFWAAGCGSNDATTTGPEGTATDTTVHDTTGTPSAATPGVPPASDTGVPAASDSGTVAPSTETLPADAQNEPAAKGASDAPKIIDKPAEPTPDDQEPKPKSENSSESP